MRGYRDSLLQALRHYIDAVLADGDYLNDWLTHMPSRMAHYAEMFGRMLAQALGL